MLPSQRKRFRVNHNKLSVTGTQPADTGVYQCIVSNEVGVATSTAHVTVGDVAPNFPPTTMPQKVFVNAGSNVVRLVLLRIGICLSFRVCPVFTKRLLVDTADGQVTAGRGSQPREGSARRTASSTSTTSSRMIRVFSSARHGTAWDGFTRNFN